MKKTLLLTSLLFSTVIYSQILQNENFDGLNVGNVGTNLEGVLPGQGDFLTYIALAGDNSNFQIVTEGSGKALQITGSTNASNARFMWKNGLADVWETRTTGNDVINIEFDLHTGAATTSKSSQNLYLYDESGMKTLVGLTFTAATKTLRGVCYLDNAGTLGNYSLNLGATPLVLPSNQWVRIGMSYNKITGQVKWKGPGFYGSFDGAATGTDPAEIDFILSPGTGNTVAYVGKFDNFIAFADDVEDLLGATDFAEPSKLELISLFPNPASTVINLSSTNNLSLEKFTIIDINGRTIKSIDASGVDASIDVSDLNAGVYFLNIQTTEGNSTKKFIKQ
ncbi:T9SS type A sorting domain-containing protein [Flavobacterium ardleyense]|uniref:T9SS type A sorting domain-containing protein n=1 Tax=Flavobacterium ardleyense TaxID=2038737 RepID=A0ABW5Z9U5_9FLAO